MVPYAVMIHFLERNEQWKRKGIVHCQLIAFFSFMVAAGTQIDVRFSTSCDMHLYFVPNKPPPSHSDR